MKQQVNENVATLNVEQAKGIVERFTAFVGKEDANAEPFREGLAPIIGRVSDRLVKACADLRASGMEDRAIFNTLKEVLCPASKEEKAGKLVTVRNWRCGMAQQTFSVVMRERCGIRMRAERSDKGAALVVESNKHASNVDDSPTVTGEAIARQFAKNWGALVASMDRKACEGLLEAVQAHLKELDVKEAA